MKAPLTLLLFAFPAFALADAAGQPEVFPPGTGLDSISLPRSLDEFESIPALNFDHPLLVSAGPVQGSALPSNPGQSAAVPPPPINLLSGEDLPLSASDARAVAMADEWVNPARSEAPGRGSDGAVVVRFGGTMPAVVCAPLRVCSIALQAGETVNQVEIGDPVRWRVTPAVTGAGAAAQTHVVVKPTDIGLSTNMIVATDRRLYNLRLVSRKDDWMPSLSFSYPEDEAAMWAAAAREQEARRVATVIEDTGQSLGDLDFGYAIRGDKPRWKPVRVYHDHRQTFIQLPAAAAHDELPALVAVGPGNAQEMVNYRLRGNLFVVDKVLDEAMLLSGVGRHQQRVTLRYKGGE